MENWEKLTHAVGILKAHSTTVAEKFKKINNEVEKESTPHYYSDNEVVELALSGWAWQLHLDYFYYSKLLDAAKPQVQKV